MVRQNSDSRPREDSQSQLKGQGEENSFSLMTVKQLRNELRSRDLQLSGKKASLISRLEGFELKMQTDSGFRGRRRAENTASATNGDSKQHNNVMHNDRQRIEDQKERNAVVVWRRPVTTLYYFVLELFMLTQELLIKLWRNKISVLLASLTFLAFLALYHTNGPHQKYVAIFQKEFLWYAYWVGLGILSSVGLGTGLHTFLLYLGPHIAAVTLGAFECMSVDFPSPPYPDDIICPEEEGTTMSILTIMSKVRIEAFMWGAGTAIGELPPYFMARAARLSGQMDEEEAEIEELIQGRSHDEKLSFLDRAKVTVHELVQKVGFVGILLCASIPNPLFDLAGITCGHFLVPFWTFFGATLIGKAVIKMHIQKLFVIFVFSEHHVHQVVSLIKYIPHFGPGLQAPFKEYLTKQKAKMHVKPGTASSQGASWLSWVFEKVVLVMVVYFVVSIINSMAQNYHKRQSKARLSSPTHVTSNIPRKKAKD